MENRDEPVKYVCESCGRTFTIKHNLKRHVLKKHEALTEKFICHLCSKAYATKFNLIRHVSKCGNNRQRCPKEVKCILCNNYTGLKINLLEHYSSDHNINIATQNLQFASFSEFEAWKDHIEKDTVSKYVRHDLIKTNDKIIYYYRCHRDGFYQCKGKHIRHLKLQGTNKIDGYCPSKIHATVLNATGKVDVFFLKTHVGHTTDLEKIPLKESDRKLLASKKSQKFPFDEIINNVRDNFGEVIIFKHLPSTSTASTSNINQYKKKVSQMFQSILGFASTIEHYKVIEKALAPILPTLTATSNVSASASSSTVPVKRKKKK